MISDDLQGKTEPLGDDSVEKAVAAVMPFVKAAEQAKRAAEGEGEERGEAGLTLTQYASLLAELRMGAERADALARYRVEGEQGLARLVASWEERAARRPDLRGQIEAAVYTWMDHSRRAGRWRQRCPLRLDFERELVSRHAGLERC